MRETLNIKAKREKLRVDLSLLNEKWKELYYGREIDESKEDKTKRYNEMRTLERNKHIICGQIEALTYVMNEDFEMTELDVNLSMKTIIHGDWRDGFRGDK